MAWKIGYAMIRDMDLVRDLLLRIEGDPSFDGTSDTQPDLDRLGISGHSYEEVRYDLAMLVQHGFVAGHLEGIEMPVISGLTWDGHELLDDIRDPNIWQKTKERTKGIASVGFGLLWEIARAEIRKRIGLP